MDHPHDSAHDSPKKSSSSPAPGGSPHGDSFLIPSPVPTKRTRTYSQSERAKSGPTHYGKIKTFCRQKGHGFIVPKEGGEPIFVHVSDIEGDIVPVEGDQVSYKRCHLPPKFEKYSAVHVQIVHLKDGVEHDRWNPHSSPNVHS